MTGIGRVREALTVQGFKPSHEDLLEVLWLARALALDDGTTARRWADGTGVDPADRDRAQGLSVAEAASAGDDAPSAAPTATDGREQLHAAAQIAGAASPARLVPSSAHDTFG